MLEKKLYKKELGLEKIQNWLVGHTQGLSHNPGEQSPTS